MTEVWKLTNQNEGESGGRERERKTENKDGKLVFGFAFFVPCNCNKIANRNFCGIYSFIGEERTTHRYVGTGCPCAMHDNVICPFNTTWRNECFSTLMRGCTKPLGSLTMIRPGYVDTWMSPTFHSIVHRGDIKTKKMMIEFHHQHFSHAFTNDRISVSRKIYFRCFNYLSADWQCDTYTFWKHRLAQHCWCTVRHSIAHCTCRQCPCSDTNACQSLVPKQSPSRILTYNSAPTHPSSRKNGENEKNDKKCILTMITLANSCIFSASKLFYHSEQCSKGHERRENAPGTLARLCYPP